MFIALTDSGPHRCFLTHNLHLSMPLTPCPGTYRLPHRVPLPHRMPPMPLPTVHHHCPLCATTAILSCHHCHPLHAMAHHCRPLCATTAGAVLSRVYDGKWKGTDVMLENICSTCHSPTLTTTHTPSMSHSPQATQGHTMPCAHVPMPP